MKAATPAMVVGIDSNIVVYAGLVARKAANGETTRQQQLVKRAKILLHELRHDTVILPMIAVSELLVPAPMSTHGLIIAELKKVFACPDFSVAAASIAADLWARHAKSSIKSKSQDRVALRADVKIIATAKATGAKLFYTNDDDCRALADLIMEGRGLPKGSNELFINEILADGNEDRPTAPRKGRTRPRGDRHSRP